MFQGLHSFGQGFGALSSLDREDGLGDDGSGIQIGRDEMDGGAVPAYASLQGALVGMQTGEGGQERWVNIDHSTKIAFHEGGSQLAEKSREDDPLGATVIDGCSKRIVKFFAMGEIPVANDLTVQALLLCPMISWGIGAITQYQTNPGRQAAFFDGSLDGL